MIYTMLLSQEALPKTLIKLVVPLKTRTWIRAVASRIQKRQRAFRNAKRIEEWNTRAAQGGYFIYKIAPNVKMKLYCDSLLSRLIFFNEFEIDEQDFMVRFLHPGDVYVDVGANAGFLR